MSNQIQTLEALLAEPRHSLAGRRVLYSSLIVPDAARSSLSSVASAYSTCEHPVSIVRDDAVCVPTAGHRAAWADLTQQGYALTSDRAVGLAENFREYFHQAYYNDQVLRNDQGDWPVDRKRARDVIRYEWHGDALDLETYYKITITDRAQQRGEREHARVKLLPDPQAEELIRAFLALVPPSRRQQEGTFGINLFRTFTNVVTAPHHDDEEFILLYILNRIGDGADSYLYDPDDVSEDGQVMAEPVLLQQLNPGDLIVFEDQKFKHGATPLISPPGGRAMRDVLVCTVDYRTTYLEPRPNRAAMTPA
jgi:hypothetical protein